MAGTLLLIYPQNLSISFAEMRFVSHILGRAGLMNVSLPTVAALTPPGVFDRVRIVDEGVEPIPHDDPDVALVGLTGFHHQLDQAREIARRFRERGVPVVCGGPSVSISPERWRDVADVLVIGEAERTWPAFVRDFVRGAHRAEYRETTRPDLALTPVPDYGGVSPGSARRFFGGIVQTSRGCPFDCEFCDVIVYVGRKMRHKPVETVVREVDQLHRMGLKAVVLADDNFSGHRARAKQILRGLRGWNRRQRRPMSFITQLSIDAARDDELLRLCAEAGLNRVCVGIESINPDSLAEAHKTPNLRSVSLEADLRRFHAHGILILGTTIVGFDNDDLTTFRRLFDFLQAAGVVSPQVFPLQAPDGTPLQRRVRAEGRYLDWVCTAEDPRNRNVFNTFTMVPRQMSVAQLQQGTLWVMRRLYELDSACERLQRFFDDFERSTDRHDLQIPPSYLDLEAAAVLARTLRHLASRAAPAERRAFARVLALARRSSHPQRFAIAVAAFLGAINVQATLRAIDPRVDRVTYPL